MTPTTNASTKQTVGRCFTTAAMLSKHIDRPRISFKPGSERCFYAASAAHKGVERQAGEDCDGGQQHIVEPHRAPQDTQRREQGKKGGCHAAEHRQDNPDDACREQPIGSHSTLLRGETRPRRSRAGLSQTSCRSPRLIRPTSSFHSA